MATEKAEKGKKLMSKQAARAAAEKEAAAKKITKPAKKKPAAKTPKAAKPKPAPKSKKPVKVKAGKPGALISVIDDSALKALQADAAKSEKILKEDMPRLFTESANVYAVWQDFKERELWRHTPTPYKSESAFQAELAQLSGVTQRTLQLIASANAALPGVPHETKKKIGARKLKKAVAAVKKLKKKTGNPDATLPDEIIEKAKTQSEQEFTETLEGAGLGPDKQEPPAKSGTIPFGSVTRDTADELLHHEAKAQPFRRGKNGGSGAVEGKRGTAQKFASVIAEAVEMAYLIYTPEQMGLADGDEAADEDVLRFIVGQWKKFPCARPGMEDMTHEQCAEHIEKTK